VADALSRMFEVPVEDESNPAKFNVALTEIPLAFEDLKVLQSQDPELSQIIRRLKDGETMDPYSWCNGALYWRTGKRGARKLVLHVAARNMVFSYFHETELGGHLGIKKTRDTIYEISYGKA
jgi:hypothetical protein